jgi:hypothetical protein
LKVASFHLSDFLIGADFTLDFVASCSIIGNQAAHTMNPLKFSCPQCDQHLQCDEQFSGREIQCPNCNHLIRIPPVPGKTAQYTPESGKTWATFVPGGKMSPPQKPSIAPKKESEPPA